MPNNITVIPDRNNCKVTPSLYITLTKEDNNMKPPLHNNSNPKK